MWFALCQSCFQVSLKVNVDTMRCVDVPFDNLDSFSPNNFVFAECEPWVVLMGRANASMLKVIDNG